MAWMDVRGRAMSVSFDGLSSTEFEEFSSDLLHASGFVNVDWRKGTGLASSPADKGREAVPLALA